MLHPFIICTQRKKQSTKTSTPSYLFTPSHHPVPSSRCLTTTPSYHSVWSSISPGRSIKRLMPQRGQIHSTSGGTYSDVFNWAGASKRLMSQRGHMNSICGGIYSDISTVSEHHVDVSASSPSKVFQVVSMWKDLPISFSWHRLI